MPPDDKEFRTALRTILERSGLSMRALSAAMGRDPGYIASLLDPSRPSRARPTPADMIRASDATGIAFVELLEALWGIKGSRLADELGRLRVSGSGQGAFDRLTGPERTSVAAYVGFLASRHSHR
jgi:transcriptional regulator with XRE-family HTH domain